MSLLRAFLSKRAVSVPTGPISALFVVGDSASPAQRDTDLALLLTARGDSVTYVDDNVVVAGDAAGHDLLYVSSSCSQAPAFSVFASTATALLCGSTDSSDGHGLTTAATTTGFTQEIVIDDNSHPITTGFATGATDILTSNTGMIAATSFGSGTALASEVGTPANKTIVYWNSGTIMADSSAAPAKRAICFLSGAAGQRLEVNGENLFLNCVDWLVL